MVDVPQGRVTHWTPTRLRIKVPALRDNPHQAPGLAQKLLECGQIEEVHVNLHAASLLLRGSSLNLDDIGAFIRDHRLLALDMQGARRVPVSKRIVSPLLQANQKLNRFSGGELDVAGLAFLSLLVIGAYQILRGRVAAPPWYTAFWYAFGVFTKVLIDKHESQKNAH